MAQSILIVDDEKEIEHKIICYDKRQKLIQIEALKYTDKVKMYASNIIDFDEDTIKDILPECFI